MFPTAMRRCLLCLVLVFGISACGRPATLQECEEIANKVAVLEFEAASKVAGPPRPEQVQVIQARVHDAMLKGCVGKRLTDRALQCVRNAKTAEVIQKECFD